MLRDLGKQSFFSTFLTLTWQVQVGNLHARPLTRKTPQDHEETGEKSLHPTQQHELWLQDDFLATFVNSEGHEDTQAALVQGTASPGMSLHE